MSPELVAEASILAAVGAAIGSGCQLLSESNTLRLKEDEGGFVGFVFGLSWEPMEVSNGEWSVVVFCTSVWGWGGGAPGVKWEFGGRRGTML